MAESFVLFDEDFICTDYTYDAKYIVITDTTKAIDDDELYNYWFDSDCSSEEIENITGPWRYYYWENLHERYLPLTDDKVIERLNEAMESCCSESNKANSSESESTEVNNTDSTPKKYKLCITLENGTIIEPNFTSGNPADFAGMIELMSSELYFAGNIKSIKIE